VSVRAFFPVLLIAVCWSCAQQGSPSGGPRDKDPPVVVGSDPPNYSIRFKAKKILITFDEYIVLDNVNQELVVSPPMEEKPEIRLRKKTMIIQFEEDLKDSTTYTFNFGSAIKDLHEGNKLLNFEYVFSTGDVLDSLSVKGTLKYAWDLTEPDEPISIMLYNDLRDSVPLTDIPLYVGRSDDSGVFSVNNLKPDVYKVFALKDGNYNFLFDLPTEEIAFLDSSLIVNAEFARSLLEIPNPVDSAELDTDTLLTAADTLQLPQDTHVLYKDSLSLSTDTLEISPDSLIEEGPDFNSIYIDLLLFTEETETQYIKNESRDDRRMVQVVFAKPVTDTFGYRFLEKGTGDTTEYLEVFSSSRDTLTLWLRDSLDFRKDTIDLELNYTVKDTAHQFVTQTDTLVFIYREKKTKQKGPETKEKEKLTITTIRNKGEQHLNRSFQFDLNLPLAAIHDSLIGLFHTPDSVEVPVPFSSRVDSLVPTRGWIDVEWESASNYHLRMLPGAITSIYDLAHDTIDLIFQTRDIEFYGQILLKLENVRHRVIVQLISKDKVIRQQFVSKSGNYAFPYLVPQNYRIKFIHDLNENGKWDTGNYMKKQQPEPVEFVPKEITVRSNWDHDVTMQMEK
jgi:hypothetical protein